MANTFDKKQEEQSLTAFVAEGAEFPNADLYSKGKTRQPNGCALALFLLPFRFLSSMYYRVKSMKTTYLATVALVVSAILLLAGCDSTGARLD